MVHIKVVVANIVFLILSICDVFVTNMCFEHNIMFELNPIARVYVAYGLFGLIYFKSIFEFRSNGYPCVKMRINEYSVFFSCFSIQVFASICIICVRFYFKFFKVINSN